ncbi:MAG: tetratricopeptide repeat protein [candidate division FCPU426 bacterium]
MGKVERLTHKQIEQAIKRDEFRDFLEGAGHWARNHVESVVIGAVLIAALAFGGVYYLKTRNESAGKASMQLASAENQFQRSLSGGPNAANYASAAGAAFQSIKSEFDASPAGIQAELGLANVAFESGKIDEARQSYEAFVRAHSDSLLAPFAFAASAACLEALNKPSEAAEIYMSLPAKYPKAANAAAALLDAARMYDAAGNKAKLKEAVAALGALSAQNRLPEGLKSKVAAMTAKAG